MYKSKRRNFKKSPTCMVSRTNEPANRWMFPCMHPQPQCNANGALQRIWKVAALMKCKRSSKDKGSTLYHLHLLWMTDNCTTADAEAGLAELYFTHDRWCTRAVRITAHRIFSILENWRNKFSSQRTPDAFDQNMTFVVKLTSCPRWNLTKNCQQDIVFEMN